MRSSRLLSLAIAIAFLTAGCSLLTYRFRAPRAPKSEAESVKFPWGEPKNRVTLSGVWLRAVTLAMDDYLPEEEAERAKTQGALAVCLARRDSYDVEAFAWSPRTAEDAGVGGESDTDGGSNPGSDAGSEGGLEAEMPKAPPFVYVQITLIPDACDFGESPPVDFGAVYAIDTVNWRVLAVR